MGPAARRRRRLICASRPPCANRSGCGKSVSHSWLRLPCLQRIFLWYIGIGPPNPGRNRDCGGETGPARPAQHRRENCEDKCMGMGPFIDREPTSIEIWVFKWIFAPIALGLLLWMYIRRPAIGCASPSAEFDTKRDLRAFCRHSIAILHLQPARNRAGGEGSGL
jgi:hypothetical protein